MYFSADAYATINRLPYTAILRSNSTGRGVILHPVKAVLFTSKQVSYAFDSVFVHCHT